MRTRSQPCESRANWAILYPSRNKRESWQSDFTGVVKLDIVNRRFWINVWSGDIYRLRLCEKDGPVKTSVCQLSPVDPGRYTGRLLLSDEDSSCQFLLRVWLRETGHPLLEVHIEVISQKEDR